MEQVNDEKKQDQEGEDAPTSASPASSVVTAITGLIGSSSDEDDYEQATSRQELSSTSSSYDHEEKPSNNVLLIPSSSATEEGIIAYYDDEELKGDAVTTGQPEDVDSFIQSEALRPSWSPRKYHGDIQEKIKNHSPDLKRVGAHRRPGLPRGSPQHASVLRRANSEEEDTSENDDMGRVNGWRQPLPSERRAQEQDAAERGLMIANAVDVVKEDRMERPAAREVDPDEKSHRLKKRRFGIYGQVCLVILIGVIVVGIALGVTSGGQGSQRDDEPIASTRSPPLSEREQRWNAIDKSLEDIFGLESSSLPFLRARDWLKHEDPMQLVPEDSNFVQRFTLALFYFQTSGDEGEDGWFSCGKARPELDETDTCGFYLLIQHIPVLDYEVTIRNRWLSSTHECIWAGVTCNALNETSEIRLEGHNMTGTLPTELAKLSALESLSLGYNELHGTVSSDFADKLEHLVSFSVEGNLLSGPLPASLLSSGTRIVNLVDNLFEGTLPSAQMADMSELAGLFVSWNLLTGTIPTEIGLLDSLVVLQISSNEFTGQLPSEVGNLQQLEALLISRQGLDSTIPTEIGLLHSSLSSFQAKGTGLKGTIPDSVYELSKLRVLDLANNFLTGSISSEISLLTSLYRLGLDDNGFGGDIPDELGELGSDDSSNGFGVQYVSLHRNPLLTGPIPEGLCGISHLWADCAKNACPDGCCTVCCGTISDHQEVDHNEQEGLSVCEQVKDSEL